VFRNIAEGQRWWPLSKTKIELIPSKPLDIYSGLFYYLIFGAFALNQIDYSGIRD